MLISIITVNYNNKENLEQTIKSVQDQNSNNFEYIVIDGDSDDGSKQVIEDNKSSFSYHMSEPDTGVYQAMNKGIRVAKGDYVFFLNSGDTFYNDNVLNDITKYLDRNVGVVYGDLMLLDSKGKQDLRSHPDNLSFDFFYQRTIAHQAAFIKRSLFDDIFYYNEQFKIVSDWEFFICAICKFNISYKHVDLIITTYDDTHGISSKLENKKLLYAEREIVLKKHFVLFLEDYRELHKHRGTLGTNRFRMLYELEAYTVPKKIMSLLLRILVKLFKRN